MAKLDRFQRQLIIHACRRKLRLLVPTAGVVPSGKARGASSSSSSSTTASNAASAGATGPPINRTPGVGTKMSYILSMGHRIHSLSYDDQTKQVRTSEAKDATVAAVALYPCITIHITITTTMSMDS